MINEVAFNYSVHMFAYLAFLNEYRRSMRYGLNPRSFEKEYYVHAAKINAPTLLSYSRLYKPSNMFKSKFLSYVRPSFLQICI